MVVQKKEINQNLKVVQGSSQALMRSLFKEKGSAGIEGKGKTITAQVLCYFQINGCLGLKMKDELR